MNKIKKCKNINELNAYILVTNIEESDQQEHRIIVKENPFKNSKISEEIEPLNRINQIAELKRNHVSDLNPEIKKRKKLDEMTTFQSEDLKRVSAIATPRLVPCNDKLKQMTPARLMSLAFLKNEANDRSLKSSLNKKEEKSLGFNKLSVSNFNKHILNIEKEDKNQNSSNPKNLIDEQS